MTLQQLAIAQTRRCKQQPLTPAQLLSLVSVKCRENIDIPSFDVNFKDLLQHTGMPCRL